MVLTFFAGEILLTFALVLLVKNKPIIIIVVYLYPPQETKHRINAKFQKHIYQIPRFYVYNYGRLHIGVDFRKAATGVWQ